MLLDIADPLECIANPWDQLEFFYRVPVEFVELNRRRVSIGQPKLKVNSLPKNYWEQQKPSDVERIKSIVKIHTNMTVDQMLLMPNARHRPRWSYV